MGQAEVHINTEPGKGLAVMLDIPAETPNSRVFRLRGLGMPKMK